MRRARAPWTAYDIVHRNVDPATRLLTTTRVVIKRGTLPRWGQHVREPDGDVRGARTG